MSDITVNQNSSHNIDLLIAQRFYYSKAKTLRNIRLIISVLFALISPIVIYNTSNYISLIGTIGGIWALFAFLSKQLLENTNIEKAAKIQEEFDTTLYEMSWNNILVVEKVPHEDISFAKRRFRGSTTKLKNWYSNVSEFPYPLDVLLCQRSNLVWDWRLKKIFSITIFCTLTIYFIATIVLSSAIELRLSEYILGLFLPALSGYFIGIDEGADHFRSSQKRRVLEKKINNLSDVALNKKKSLKITELRQIQNCIYEFRKGPLIPDWFYWFFRKDYNKNMIAALNNFKRRLKE